MTKRERFLIGSLAWLIVGLGGVFVATLVLDELQRLDSDFLTLQKVALRHDTQAVGEGESLSGSSLAPRLESQFWPKGSLPAPLELARAIRPLLDRYGVEVKEVQVTRADSEAFILRYSLRSPMDQFLRAATQIQADLPRFQVWGFAANVAEKGDYVVQWEVGYAAAP